jgi:hypothetical protein
MKIFTRTRTKDGYRTSTTSTAFNLSVLPSTPLDEVDELIKSGAPISSLPEKIQVRLLRGDSVPLKEIRSAVVACMNQERKFE